MYIKGDSSCVRAQPLPGRGQKKVRSGQPLGRGQDKGKWAGGRGGAG